MVLDNQYFSFGDTNWEGNLINIISQISQTLILDICIYNNQVKNENLFLKLEIHDLISFVKRYDKALGYAREFLAVLSTYLMTTRFK